MALVALDKPYRSRFPGWLWHLGGEARLPGGRQARALAPLLISGLLNQPTVREFIRRKLPQPANLLVVFLLVQQYKLRRGRPRQVFQGPRPAG